MKIFYSEKHAEHVLSKSLPDKIIPPECIRKSTLPGWLDYVVIRMKPDLVWYINLKTNILYPEYPYATSRALSKGTIVTFHQDSLE